MKLRGLEETLWMESRFLTLSFWLYKTARFSPGACSCQELPTACSSSAPAMPEHGPTQLGNTSLHRNMLPAVLEARPLGKSSARVFTSWCQQRKCLSWNMKARRLLGLFTVQTFWCSLDLSTSSQPFLLTNCPGNFKLSSFMSGWTWNRFKNCWGSGGRPSEPESAFLSSSFPRGFLWVHQRPLGLPGEPTDSPISAALGIIPIHNLLPPPDVLLRCCLSYDKAYALSWKPTAPPCTDSFLLPLASSLHHTGDPHSSLKPSPFPTTFSTAWGNLARLWGAAEQKTLLPESFMGFRRAQHPNQEQNSQTSTIHCC